MSENTPSMDRVRNMYARIMKPDGTVALWSRRQKEFDRWLAAHDQALREQIARAIEDQRGHFIAETTLTRCGLPAWADAYLNGLDDAIYVALVEGSE